MIGEGGAVTFEKNGTTVEADGTRRVVGYQPQTAGFLLNAAQPDVVRLAPPLVLTDEQADRFLTALPALLDSAQEQS